MSVDHIARAKAYVREAMDGLADRERLRHKTLLALLTAEGVDVPNARSLDSDALRKLLDQHYDQAA
jgi:hypothetical protein